MQGKHKKLQIVVLPPKRKWGKRKLLETVDYNSSRPSEYKPKMVKLLVMGMVLLIKLATLPERCMQLLSVMFNTELIIGTCWAILSVKNMRKQKLRSALDDRNYDHPIAEDRFHVTDSELSSSESCQREAETRAPETVPTLRKDLDGFSKNGLIVLLKMPNRSRKHWTMTLRNLENSKLTTALR